MLAAVWEQSLLFRQLLTCCLWEMYQSDWSGVSLLLPSLSMGHIIIVLIHDTQCPYWDQVSLNYTQLKLKLIIPCSSSEQAEVSSSIVVRSGWEWVSPPGVQDPWRCSQQGAHGVYRSEERRNHTQQQWCQPVQCTVSIYLKHALFTFCIFPLVIKYLQVVFKVELVFIHT